MTAGPFVIDASVFLNAFIPAERGSEVSREALRRLQGQAAPLIAPTLLLPEAAAAIRRGQQDADLARRFALTLSRLPHLILVPLDLTLAQQALEIAAQAALRGSDSVYAAVAQRFACPLVTLDQEQRRRTSELVKTYSPSELLELLIRTP